MDDIRRDLFERWLADGSMFIGVFENKELGHPDLGQRVAMAFDIADWDRMIVGQTRMPDGVRLIGWRYILEQKCNSVDEAMKAMEVGDGAQA